MKIKKRTAFVLLFLLLECSYNLKAQNRNSVWCFGDSAGIDFNNTSSPVTFQTSLDTRGSCVSIADSNGQLLFYANTRATIPGNTTLVWNKNHQLMQNGNSIVGRGWYDELIIIPFPEHTDKYYLFSVGSTSIFGFYYSIIDMSQNSGLGSVIQKNVMLDSYQAWDAMSAVKHGNGRDWWIITKDYDNVAGDNNFHIYLITPDTIIGKIQFIGASEYGNAGNMTFSKDGNNFSFISYNGVIEVMDFDRCSGVFSNEKLIDNNPGRPRYWGSAFSNNGDILYVSTSDTSSSKLYQFDLTIANIAASRITLDSILLPRVAGGALRLAPDSKLYWSCAWYDGIHFNYPYQDTVYHTENMNLSVINDPDVLGTGCNFSLYSFYLGGKRTYWGLPNNPDYSLGPVLGSICDSLTNGIPSLNNLNSSIRIYPNPFHSDIRIHGLNLSDSRISITNELGEIVYTSIIQGSESDISLSNLPSGIYILKIINRGEFFQQILIKEN